MILTRRDLFPVLTAGVASAGSLLAQHAHSTTPLDFSGYRPRVFTGDEFALLDAITETIFPADDSGPGAHAAHVNYYIDTVLHYRPANDQTKWRQGLAAINAAAVEAHGKSYLTCSPAEQYEVLSRMAEQESDPKTPSDLFFVQLKSMSIEAFYASTLAQQKHLGYRGNTAIEEFPGCTHE